MLCAAGFALFVYLIQPSIASQVQIPSCASDDVIERAREEASMWTMGRQEIGGEPQCELSGRGQGLLSRRLDGELSADPKTALSTNARREKRRSQGWRAARARRHSAQKSQGDGEPTMVDA